MRKAIPRGKSPRLMVFLFAVVIGLTTAVAGFMSPGSMPRAYADLPDGPVTMEQVARGRVLAMGNICANCHNAGRIDPGDPQWLAGFVTSRTGPGKFQIGSFTTYARNLTPDNATGLGRISARQIFNSLRYGLKPGDTPDMVISSNVPGQGNFPATPRYLAPPMPWPVFRHLPDEDLWAIAAYLKHGIKPVTNRVEDSQGPPDFWASSYSPGVIGPFPQPPYPAANEEFRP